MSSSNISSIIFLLFKISFAKTSIAFIVFNTLSRVDELSNAGVINSLVLARLKKSLKAYAWYIFLAEMEYFSLSVPFNSLILPQRVITSFKSNFSCAVD